MENDVPGVVDEQFSAPGAEATPWSEVRQELTDAEIWWLTTVRRDGRPHVTPLITVWVDDALHFCTGVTEQKARNLEHEPRCALTTGANALGSGLDIVVEGVAVRVEDDATLRRLVEAWVEKYGEDWRFQVGEGAFDGDGGKALVYRVDAAKMFAFRKGDYAMTRWRFASP